MSSRLSSSQRCGNVLHPLIFVIKVDVLLIEYVHEGLKAWTKVTAA